MVIPPQFDCYYLGKFTEGRALVKLGEKWGFIDKTGKLVIPPQFEKAGGFSEGLAPVQRGEKWGFIDRTGKMVIEPQFGWPSQEPFTEGLAAVSVDKKLFGYIDKTGKMVIPPKYYRAVWFSEGLAAVQTGEEEGSSTVGFIDKTGRMVIPPQFYLYLDLTEGHFTNYMGVFSGGLAEVWQNPDTSGPS